MIDSSLWNLQTTVLVLFMHKCMYIYWPLYQANQGSLLLFSRHFYNTGNDAWNHNANVLSYKIHS